MQIPFLPWSRNVEELALTFMALIRRISFHQFDPVEQQSSAFLSSVFLRLGIFGTNGARTVMNSSSLDGKVHEIEASDGHRFDCFVVSAQGARRGGLVILQEIFGVTDQLKTVARQYAKQGFEVAIPALFDRKRRDAVIPFDEAAVGREIMLSMDVADNLLDIEAAVGFLGEEKNAAVLGFCWGGGLALKSAQEMSVGCAIAFYGTRLKQFMDKSLQAPMLFHFGSKDEHSPPDVIAAIQGKFPEAETYVYDAGHAFANDARPAFYVEDAAILAHERSKAILDRVFPTR